MCTGRRRTIQPTDPGRFQALGQGEGELGANMRDQDIEEMKFWIGRLAVCPSLLFNCFLLTLSPTKVPPKFGDNRNGGGGKKKRHLVNLLYYNVFWRPFSYNVFWRPFILQCNWGDFLSYNVFGRPFILQCILETFYLTMYFADLLSYNVF